MMQFSEGERLVRGLGLAVLLSLTVMACQQQPLPGVDPTPPRASPPPEGSSQAVPPLSVTGETAVPVGNIEEESSGWEEKGKEKGSSEAQHQADLQACYAFANAQVRHDEKITDDRQTLYGGSNSSQAGNLFSYNKNMRPFSSEQRFDRLFSDCMRSRGYQQD